MVIEDKQRAEEYLRLLKDRGSRNIGICYLIHDHSTYNYREFNDLLVGICKDLGVYSGTEVYPIRHPRLPPMKAWEVCSKWSIFTRYGRARRRVLKRLIKHFEEIANR